MAEIGSGSGTGYPNAIDTDTSKEYNTGEASPTLVRAEPINDLAAAVVAIETELGTTPKGSSADVATRLSILLAQRIINFPADCFHTRAGTAGWAGFSEVQGTNLDYATLDFDKDTNESAYSPPFKLANWDAGNITVKIYWIANATSGDAYWIVSFLGRAETEAFDAAVTAHQLTEDTVGDTAYDLVITSEALSCAELAANDFVVLKLTRHADDAKDTLAVDAKVLAVELTWTES